MAVLVYKPNETQIIHKTTADLVIRSAQSVIHLVQYDNALPIIAVELFQNGDKYTVPNDATVMIKWKKPDQTYIYNETLGCSEDRSTVYFTVMSAMTVLPGNVYPNVEVTLKGSNHAQTATFPVCIEKSPIQEDDIKSEDYSNILDVVFENIEKVSNAAASAKQSADKAETAASSIQADLNKKVDKEDGKGLSSNDFTDELKTKLEGLEPETGDSITYKLTGGFNGVVNLIGSDGSSSNIVIRTVETATTAVSKNSVQINLTDIQDEESRQSSAIYLTEDRKISVYDIRDTKVRTVASNVNIDPDSQGSVYDDFVVGDYIFHELVSTDDSDPMKDYTKLEYIQSTGTQYIDTGIGNMTDGYNGYVKFQLDSTSVQGCIMGAHGLSAPYGRNNFSLSSTTGGEGENKLQLGAGNSFPFANVAVNTTTVYEATFCTARGSSYLVINGERCASSTDSNARTDFNILLFNNQYAVITKASTAHAKIFEAKIYDLEGNLLGDYIPCMSKITGEIGMFDMVTKKFLANKGSGVFGSNI